MKIFIGSDHAAYQAKKSLKDFLTSLGHELVDLGTSSEESCHYPDFAIEVCERVTSISGARGILLCGSGIGMSIVANRFQGIRAALCKSEEEAKLSRMHNDANVLCLGARVSSEELIQRMATLWIETAFEGGRHQERIDKFNQLGERPFRHNL